jgi:HTH-like domain
MDHHLPVTVVCRVLGAPRSTIYARRRAGDQPGRRGPVPATSDEELVGLIRRVLAGSPFAGEGYRKVRARLRREHQVHVSGKRVLRQLRREGLLAPQRVRGRRRRHCCIEPKCAGEAQQRGGSPSWKGAKKGPNHSTVPMICRL